MTGRVQGFVHFKVGAFALPLMDEVLMFCATPGLGKKRARQSELNM